MVNVGVDGLRHFRLVLGRKIPLQVEQHVYRQPHLPITEHGATFGAVTLFFQLFGSSKIAIFRQETIIVFISVTEIFIVRHLLWL